MSVKDDGGPAFPGSIAVSAVGDVHEGGSGMTLRDWFAGQTLIALENSSPILPGEAGGGHFWPEPAELARRRAVFAYLQADAMLAARTTGEK
jgi:hypothetical protein